MLAAKRSQGVAPEVNQKKTCNMHDSAHERKTLAFPYIFWKRITLWWYLWKKLHSLARKKFRSTQSWSPIIYFWHIAVLKSKRNPFLNEISSSEIRLIISNQLGWNIFWGDILDLLRTILTIITKYCFLIREWGGLCMLTSRHEVAWNQDWYCWRCIWTK